MKRLKIEIDQDWAAGCWSWFLVWPREFSEKTLACGTSPDYDQACRMAKIAWEQHSEGSNE